MTEFSVHVNCAVAVARSSCDYNAMLFTSGFVDDVLYVMPILLLVRREVRFSGSHLLELQCVYEADADVHRTVAGRVAMTRPRTHRLAVQSHVRRPHHSRPPIHLQRFQVLVWARQSLEGRGVQAGAVDELAERLSQVADDGARWTFLVHCPLHRHRRRRPRPGIPR